VPPSGLARLAPAYPKGVTYVKVHSVPRFSGGESCDEIKDEDED
jgi:hypothetical protein